MIKDEKKLGSGQKAQTSIGEDLNQNEITAVVQVMGDVKPAYPDKFKYKII